MLCLGRFPSSRRPVYLSRVEDESTRVSSSSSVAGTAIVTAAPLPPVSVTAFLGTSAAVFAGGVYLGFRRIRTLEPDKSLVSQALKSSALMQMAMKALLIGTALSVSGMGLLIGTFAVATGIYDAPTLAVRAKDTLHQWGIVSPTPALSPAPTAEEQMELDHIESELEKAYNALFGDGDWGDNDESMTTTAATGADGHSNTVGATGTPTSLNEDEIRKQLSWQRKFDRLSTFGSKLSDALALAWREKTESNNNAMKTEQAEARRRIEEDERAAGPSDVPKWRRKLNRIMGWTSSPTPSPTLSSSSSSTTANSSTAAKDNNNKDK